MGFSANWDNDEKTILRQLYIDRWTVDDFIACTDKTYRLLNNMPHTVHVLITYHKPRAPPPIFCLPCVMQKNG